MNAIQRLNLAAHRESIYIQLVVGILFALLIAAAAAIELSFAASRLSGLRTKGEPRSPTSGK